MDKSAGRHRRLATSELGGYSSGAAGDKSERPPRARLLPVRYSVGGMSGNTPAGAERLLSERWTIRLNGRQMVSSWMMERATASDAPEPRGVSETCDAPEPRGV